MENGRVYQYHYIYPGGCLVVHNSIYMRHRRSQRGQRGHGSPKFLENIVILCFERRFSKQNVVIRLQSNIFASPEFLPPQTFGLATSLLCELAFSILLNIKQKRLPCEKDMRIALPETKPRISQIVARK